MAIDEDVEGRELAWKQYELHVEMVKFYFDVVVKINAFFYTGAGAIFVYILEHDRQKLRGILAIPFALGLMLAALTGISLPLLKNTSVELQAIAVRLKLQTFPSTDPLHYLLITTLIGLVISMITIGYFFFQFGI